MISFTALKQMNFMRCVATFKHPLNLWSVTDWGAATAGECGEACNVAKKLLRIRTGLAQFNKDGIGEIEYKQKLADEIADMIIYADLWAQSEGIDLGEAVMNKFNRDSIKHNAKEKLSPM